MSLFVLMRWALMPTRLRRRWEGCCTGAALGRQEKMAVSLTGTVSPLTHAANSPCAQTRQANKSLEK
jgi:hypothetical protein